MQSATRSSPCSAPADTTMSASPASRHWRRRCGAASSALPGVRAVGRGATRANGWGHERRGRRRPHGVVGRTGSAAPARDGRPVRGGGGPGSLAVLIRTPGPHATWACRRDHAPINGPDPMGWQTLRPWSGPSLPLPQPGNGAKLMRDNPARPVPTGQDHPWRHNWLLCWAGDAGIEGLRTTIRLRVGEPRRAP